MKKSIFKNCIIATLSGVTLVLVAGWYHLGYSHEKTEFLDRTKHAMEESISTIKLSELFSGSYDTLCILRGYEIPSEFGPKLQLLEKYGNYQSAKLLWKLHENSENKYLIFLVSSDIIEQKFAISDFFYVDDKTYRFDFYSWQPTCQSFDTAWIQEEHARNAQILKIIQR